jgi:integrase
MMKKQSIRIPGTGRIYKRGAVWYLDYWVDGCRRQEKGSGSKEEALRILAARRADAERGEVGFEKKQVVHFSDFADEYLKIKAEKRSIRSIKGYVKHLKAYFGEVPLSRITPESVEQYKQKRLKDKVVVKKKTTRTMKGPSVNRELATLKNLFAVAEDRKKFRGENPVGKICFSPEHPRDYVPNLEEVLRLLEHSDETLRKIILIAVNTMLRKGEILTLRWSQVNVEERLLTFARTKSAKFLRIPINTVVEEVLATIDHRGEYVFPGRWGRGHLKDVKKQFNPARVAAGLPELHFHDLRSFAATEAGDVVPLAAVQGLLGHQDPRTTMRYIRRKDELKRKGVDALAALFTKKPDEGVTNVGQPAEPEGATANESIN